MSGDIKKSIKGRINKIKDTLSRKKELIAAGFMLATGSTGVSCNPIPEHFNSGEEKVVRLPENPSSKIVQDAASEMKSLSTEDAVRTLEEHGAFFVDYENFVKTGDVSSSIVYFTQEQMAEKGLKSIGTSPYDVSLARENHAVLTGDKEKDAETKMKAFSNIKGTFNGGYQFNKSNMENIVLWGLIQEDNQEIKDFCKKFVRPGVDIEKDQRFAKYSNQWQKEMSKVKQGKYSETYALNLLCRTDNSNRASALSCLEVNKPNFNKISKENPKASEIAQQGFCDNVYLRMSKYYKDFRNASFTAAPAAFSAYIHMPNASATPGILKNAALSEQQKAQQIINRESSQGSHGRKLMEQAQASIYNKGFPELECFKEWAEITGREDVVKGINKGVELLASSQIEKIPVDKNMYASITTNAEGTAQAIFQKQSQHTL